MRSPSGDTATPEGLAEEAKAERVHKGRALISLLIFINTINGLSLNIYYSSRKI